MYNNNDKTELMKAIIKGDIAQIRYLIEQGADYRLKDSNGDTALSIAASKVYIKILDYLNTLGKEIK